VAGVVLEGISKVFPGGVTAVAPMDLEIADGEFVVLVGPSGCGKSTTLRMVAGLETATTGRIRIGDRVVNDIEPKDRNVAMVFQSYALYPHMSVRENLAFGLKMRKLPRDEIRRKVGEVARVLGIVELLDRRPRALSGGQRQRVALGRAIVRDPDAFLFDEPLSNLDAKMRVQMRTEISRLHHDLGATMIYVTHDQVEAMTLGQRIVVMNRGIVQQVDTPLALYDRPANRFVAGFIGSPAMNFLPGKLVREDGLHFLVDAASALDKESSEVPPTLLEDVPAPVADTRAPLPLALPAAFQPPESLLRQPVVLGIRPEHVALAGSGGFASGKALLRVVELLGNETLLHLDLAGWPLTVRAQGQPSVKVDDEVGLALQAAHIHLFAADSGENLLLS
jgi:multiple sugar transport system ATP-binding protein